MFYISEGKAYKQVGDMCVGCNVSAERNQLTGAIISVTVEEVGEEREVPAGSFPATIDEIVAKFGVAETPLVFSGQGQSSTKAEKTKAELLAEAEARGIAVPAKATKADIQNLLDESE